MCLCVCVGEWVEREGRLKKVCDQEEKYVRFHPCLGIIVCLCVHSCPETGPLHSGGVSFFFFPVLIPHSDHSSSACTRKTNNASDMSLVEQRLFAQLSPPFLLTLLSTRSTVQCVSVLSIDSSQSDKSLHLDYLGFIWKTSALFPSGM